MDLSSKTLKSSSRVTLPIEIIFSCILPKLPANSLLRFKRVSKSFLTEISSPEFNALFSEASQCLLIVPGNYQTFRMYELDSPHSPPTFCPYPIPSKWDVPNISIVACCESYLLIGCGFIQYGRVVLLNPTTRIYHIIPRVHVPGNSSNVHYGICHCSDELNNDDFKIVRFVYYNRLREVMVYSLRSNSWKRIEYKKPTTELIRNPVLVQNHLLAMICLGSGGRKPRIGCFNIKSERWTNDVLLSDIILDEIGSNSTPSNKYYLGVLDGKLRFSCYAENKSTCDIWVMITMKEYGVKESWVKLMSVPVQGLNDVYHPIAYHKVWSHELLCIPKNSRYAWYNLKNKQFTKIADLGLDTSCFPFPYLCKGSLLNLPGGQPIRLSSKKQEDGEDNYDDYVEVY